jgi:hypothetical protein
VLTSLIERAVVGVDDDFRMRSAQCLQRQAEIVGIARKNGQQTAIIELKHGYAAGAVGRGG